MPSRKRNPFSRVSFGPLILMIVVAAAVVGWTAMRALSGDARSAPISATAEGDSVEQDAGERGEGRGATMAGLEDDAPGDAPRGGARRDTAPVAHPGGGRGKQDTARRGASMGQLEPDSPKGAPLGRTEGAPPSKVASAGDTLQPTSAPRDSGARGGGWLEWAALVLAVAGLVAAFRLSRALNQLRYVVEELRGSQTRRSLSDAERPQRSAWTPDPEPDLDEPALDGLVGEVRALRCVVDETSEEVEELRKVLNARHGTAVPQPPQSAAAGSSVGARPAAEGVRILKAAISTDEVVRLNNSHRPMIEIRWREGAPQAEAWINPDYMVADLITGRLATAFHLEGGGPGAYETLAPAVIDWDPIASEGRVRQKGRARLRP